MIATLTLNPAIDKSTEVEQLIPEKKLRCSEMICEPGGGGINVSKGLCELGEDTMSIFPCGGINGKLLLQLLGEKPIKVNTIEINGNTRESVVVNETSTSRQFKFIMPGPAVSEKEMNEIKAKISRLTDVSFLVCSGSLPPGIPDDFLAEIAAIANGKGIKFIVDTSGEALKKALEEGVYLIKPNMSELCFLTGKKYIQTSEIEKAVDQVMAKNRCEVLVVSMGPAGAMFATKEMRKRLPAPVVKKISTVGAGDSMLAGIAWMLEKQKTLEEAIQFGIACGTAATINKGTQLFKKEDAFRLFDWVQRNS